MGVRKNAARLRQDERRRYIEAVKILKTTETVSRGGRVISVYDQFVAIHLGVTRRYQWLEGPRGRMVEGQPATDGGHGDASFLPWHREYLRRYERALQQVDPEVTVPYWDWADPSGTENVVFQDDFMGPIGDGTAEATVQTGHFLLDAGWSIRPELHIRGFPSASRRNGRGLMRRGRPFADLPVKDIDVKRALDQTVYTDFRPQLEGAVAVNPGERRLHNYIHVWVGGSMVMMTSPNDPIFFMHHANIDRIWAQWQMDGHEGADHYAVGGGRPYGHNIDDKMWPWDGGRGFTVDWVDGLLPPYDATDQVRVRDVIDYANLDYEYDRFYVID